MVGFGLFEWALGAGTDAPTKHMGISLGDTQESLQEDTGGMAFRRSYYITVPCILMSHTILPTKSTQSIPPPWLQQGTHHPTAMTESIHPKSKMPKKALLLKMDTRIEKLTQK